MRGVFRKVNMHNPDWVEEKTEDRKRRVRERKRKKKVGGMCRILSVLISYSLGKHVSCIILLSCPLDYSGNCEEPDVTWLAAQFPAHVTERKPLISQLTLSLHKTE